MIKIFLSHTKKDEATALHIKHLLEFRSNINCYIFEVNSNRLQTSIPTEVADQIKSADYVLLLWSQAVAENHAWVDREFDMALQLDLQKRNEGRTDAFLLIMVLDSASSLPAKIAQQKYMNFSENEVLQLKQDLLKAAVERQNPVKDKTVTFANPKSTNKPKVSFTVADFMTKDVAVISGDETLEDAAIEMQNLGFRHLVVQKADGSIEGFISQRDVYKKLPPPFERVKHLVRAQQYQAILKRIVKMPIKSFMATANQLIVLESEDPVEEAFRKLIEPQDFHTSIHRISALPIVQTMDKKKTCVGVLSYVDLLCKFNDKLPIPNEKIDKYLPPNMEDVICVYEDDTLQHVQLTMREAVERHLPVLNKSNVLTGMVDDIIVNWMTSGVAEFEELLEKPIQSFMEPIHRVHCLNPDDKINEIAYLFCDDKTIGALPVLRGKEFVGKIRYVDILEAILFHLQN